MKKKWEIDVAVLCIFFVRDEQFARTFQQVRKAKPKILLLYQDGPREGNPGDIKGIRKCREIAEEIDWECEVHKWYQKKNVGCDPSTFMAHKWAFSIIDKCVVLEDDVVVSQSFFCFCKELLDIYENDTRINRICGMNNVGTLENYPYSYFFSSSASVWGWATWKRVADTWDENYSFLDDEYHMKALAKIYTHKDFKKYLNTCIMHRKSGKAHWETIQSFSSILNSRINIVAAVNMVCNIGISENSTHVVADLRQIPKGTRRVFNMKIHEIAFPLKHPPYLVDNKEYIKQYSKILGNNYPVIELYRKMESIILRLRYGNTKSVIDGIKRRLKSNGN
jgi:hypothetical protein